MEDRETAWMRKYGESKTTQIMMATVLHVTSGLGLRKFQADGYLLTRVYMWIAVGSHNLCVCVCVCVCARARACARACVRTADSYFFYINETDTVKCSSYDTLS